ncbi:InlB B-repeat-containing protein [Cohnella zeiphila]|uniref:InlB B-repeat-containing protein n=1 Tax=Cohnella zeiphila TaxID=2761120 RepID=A0A7X0SSD0_9BACL|nr:InlB B-repeat-containing protein [Cohnella zeiphila]MBB6735253.1 InlB B-repeat-containing protein [Cohnella zeiphila]
MKQAGEKPREKIGGLWIRTAFLLLLAVAIGLPAMSSGALAATTGTADGTYDFGGAFGPDAGGYKTVGDKFLISSGFEHDGSGTKIWSADQQNAGDLGNLVIKAENTYVNRGFTFKDLGISAVDSSAGQVLSFLNIQLFDKSGNPIDSFSNYSSGKSTITLSTGTLQLSALLNSGARYDYKNVVTIVIVWQYASGIAPSNLNFDNITVANVKSAYFVTYNANGSTGGSLPTDNNDYSAGDTATVQSAGSLTKTGYTFAGWNTAANGSGTGYSPGATMTVNGNVTLFAQWTAIPTYTVTYNGNGATGGTVPTDSGAYLSGATATVKDAGTLVRAGYAFAGWNTAAGGGGTSYAAGAPLTIGSANVTLYAQWTALPTYTVTYNGNGATGGTAPTDGGAYLSGATATVKGAGTLVRAGYAFAGWNTAAGGGGTSYAAGAPLTIGSANVTLYAQWTALPTYTVTYNGNGALSGTVPTDSGAYLSGATAIVKDAGTLVRAGYAFAGWNTAASGGGTSYAAGAPLTIGSASVTLYAQWTALPTYTVTYNGNGALSGTVPTDSGAYLSGATATVKGAGTLAWRGYSFVGWNTEADGSGQTYSEGSGLTIGSANVVLYAKWTALLRYTVKYNGNGAMGGSAPTDSGVYYPGDSATVQGAGTLAWRGYSFAGWNTKADGSGLAYTDGSALPIGYASVMLYAQWTALPTYTITYDGNGAASGSAPTDNNDYLAGDSATVEDAGTLTKPGYAFAGWNTVADGSGSSYATGSALAIGSADVVLYAQWTTLPTYTITYDGNGATKGSAPTDSVAYLSGATATVKDAGTLAKTGYSFAGWNASADGSGTSYMVGSELQIGSADVVLYAQWTTLPTYTITYDGNGATEGSAPTDSGAYLSGATATVKDAGMLAKTGYTFAGWNTEADGSGTSYAAGATVTVTGNATLYAQWSETPTEPAGPISSPIPSIRWAIVEAGTDSSLREQAPIARIVEADGTRTDEVDLDLQTADSIVELARTNGKDTVRVIVGELPGDPADRVLVRFAKEVLDRLSQAVSVEIDAANATLSFSRAALAAWQGNELRIALAPVLEADRQQNFISRAAESEALKEAAGEQSAQWIGSPTAIGTGADALPAWLLFPLQESGLPSDEAERSAFLSSLSVYVEHEDGGGELLAGKIKYDDDGQPVGVEAESPLESSDTFAIVKLPEQRHLPYMKGFSDGTFRPDAPLTRAEVAAMLDRFLRMEETAEAEPNRRFADIKPGYWAAEAVAAVSRAGLMTGDANGLFHPDAGVSRADMAAIVVRWKKLPTDGQTSSFTDTQGHRQEAGIAAAAEAGYLTGDGSGAFRPDRVLTRAEAVALFNRLEGRGPLTGVSKQTWSDVPPSHWAYDEIEEATVAHTVKRGDNGTEVYSD